MKYGWKGCGTGGGVFHRPAVQRRLRGCLRSVIRTERGHKVIPVINMRIFSAALLGLTTTLALSSTIATAQLAGSRSWHPLAALPVAADGLAAITLADGSVLAIGGDAAARGATRLAVRYMPSHASWVRLPDAPVPLANVGATTST